MRIKLAAIIPLSVLVWGGIQLNGCSNSSSDFVTTSYQNFISYFNTYYNAKKTFDQAVEETEGAQPRTRDFRLFAAYVVPQTAKTKFLSVIEKCSKLIQFYPHSNLVDDALFMIGKSYLYLNEILPARRKFTELLDNFPRSNVQFEARLGIAKTHYASQSGAETLDILKKLIADAVAQNERDIAIEALLLEGQIYFDRLDYTEAAKSYSHALEISGSDKLHGFAQFQLAQCYHIKGDDDSASKAYMKVLDFDPDFSLYYRARLGAAMTFSALGDLGRALSLLEDLGKEKLSAEDRSYVDLEIANIYQKQGDYPKANKQYALVDSLYKHTDAAAKSYYQAGLMYEKKLSNFPEARLYYDKAKSEFTQSDVTDEAIKKSDVLGRYLLYRGELAKYDSLLAMALHPRVPVQGADTLQPKSDSTMKSPRGDQVSRDSVSRKGPLTKSDSLKLATASVPIDTIHYRRASNQFDLAILFFMDLDQPDSAVHRLSALVREYPDSKFAPRALYALAEVYRSKPEPTASDSILQVLLNKYPESEYALRVKKLSGQETSPTILDSAELRYTNAENSFKAGNELLALDGFKDIATRYHGTALGTKARYAVGWIYENVLFQNDSATVHYRLLVKEQPQSIYADRIRPKLAAKDNPAPPDSLHGPSSKGPLKSGQTENANESAKKNIDKKPLVPEKSPQQVASPDSTQKKNEGKPQ